MYYFTADEHHRHQNIIRYCKRPWKFANEMSEEIIARHNEVVTEEDIVFHLGDFALGDPANFLRRLRGKEHHLIMGNHDKRKLAQAWFTSVQDVCLLQVKKEWVWMSHYAHRVWPKKHWGALHVYGHSHGTLPARELSWDVGVDANNFYPVSLEQLRERVYLKGGGETDGHLHNPLRTDLSRRPVPGSEVV